MKPAKFKEVERVLKSLGYRHIRTNGSHFMFGRKAGDPVVSVPRHGSKPVGAGILRNILSTIGIDEEEFNRLK